MKLIVCGKCGSSDLKKWNPDEDKCMGCGAMLETLDDYELVEVEENV